MKKYLAGEAGFTLPEMLAVLVIIGVLAGVAVSSLNRNMAHWELRTAARTMVSDLRAARDLAMTRGTGTVVSIYKDRGFYTLERRDGKWENVYLPKRVRFTTGYINSKGEPKTCANSFSFTPAGTSNGGTTKLETATGEPRYVIVYANTGRVRESKDPP
jgi:type II secretion system protein H